MSNTEIPILLYQAGALSVTTSSIPSLLVWPLYLAVCFWLSVKSKTLRTTDLFLLVCTGFLQIAFMPLIVGAGATQFGVFALSWPIIGFLFGYGAWRLAGNRPLQNWPWYRFGFVATALLMMVDIGGAFVISPPPGKIWQLGGAGFLDALVLAPPLFMLVFYGFLDCKSPLVFCSKGCREANRCLYGMAETVGTDKREQNKTLSRWKRIVISIVLATAVFFAYSGLIQKERAPEHLLPAAVSSDLGNFVQEMSEKYKIPSPELIQTGAKTISYTMKSEDGSHVVIHLGELFTGDESIVNDPEASKAIIAHEMAHAVLFARDQGFPNALILIGYVLSIAMLLITMPTVRSIVLGGVAILTGLLIATEFMGASPHFAVMRVMVFTTGAGILCFSLFNGKLRKAGKWARHVPHATSFTAASLLATVFFFFGMALIGSLNHTRELFADRVAACEVGSMQIAATLTRILDKTASQRTLRIPHMEKVSDPFHPSLESRLENLRNPDLLTLCKNL